MAAINLSVAQWVAEVEATDDEAVIAILEAYERAFHLDNTLEPEVRLQNMLVHLVGHIERVARDQLAREASEAAHRAVMDGDEGRW